MKIEQQVCTLEQAKRLVEIGLYAPSLFVYFKADNHSGIVLSGMYMRHVWIVTGCAYEASDVNITPAYTVSELGVMLPTLGFEFVKSNDGKGKDFFWVSGSYWKINGFKIHDPNEASARARMLIHLLESKIVTPDEINACLTS